MYKLQFNPCRSCMIDRACAGRRRWHGTRHPRVVCTDSSRTKGEGRFKNSWHIILHDIGGFCNGATATSKGGDMQLYFEAFFASLQAPELTALDSETWDVSVYNKNSNMRCIGSHKVDDDSRTRMQPHDKYTGAKMSDYYVQQPGLEVIALPTSMIPIAIERTASVPRARAGTTTQADIPDDLRVYLEGKGMTIRSALTENGCKIVKVNCRCPFAGREHTNNGQYVTITGNRAYLKCHGTPCQGKRQLLDWCPPTTEPRCMPTAPPADDESPQLGTKIPDNVRDGLIEHARKQSTCVILGHTEVLNAAHEGERVYSVQCSGRKCPKCDDDGFTVKYRERTNEFLVMCGSCKINDVVGRLSTTQSTHYTLLEVDPSAPFPVIQKAYRNAIAVANSIDDAPGVDATGLCDSLEAAYNCLRDPSLRVAYDTALNNCSGGGVGFRDLGSNLDCAITLADIRHINEMLYQYLMSEQYQRYLPGYREGVEMDIDTVVGKGWVQWYKAPKNAKAGEPIGDDECEPMLSVELHTGGTDFVCPYGHCAHKHKGENLRLT